MLQNRFILTNTHTYLFRDFIYQQLALLRITMTTTTNNNINVRVKAPNSSKRDNLTPTSSLCM